MSYQNLEMLKEYKMMLEGAIEKRMRKGENYKNLLKILFDTIRNIEEIENEKESA